MQKTEEVRLCFSRWKCAFISLEKKLVLKFQRYFQISREKLCSHNVQMIWWVSNKFYSNNSNDYLVFTFIFEQKGHTFMQFCGSVINRPPGSGLGSWLFVKKLKKFRKKVNILTFLMIYCLFDNIFFSLITNMSRYNPDPDGSVIIWPPGSWSGFAIQD